LLAVSEPRSSVLHLYTQQSEHPALKWDWVAGQLAAAGTYWVIAAADSPFPHPRPVWGVWHVNELHLSLGSPALRRGLATDPHVTVHLESGTDVVILEGLAESGAPTSPALLDVYRDKYDWDYDAGQYGDLLRVTPVRILAWRAKGWAGRESFAETGRWDFDVPGEAGVSP
jgi:hypothetical protein